MLSIKSLSVLLLSGAVLAVAASAGGDLPSGPQVGQKLTPFKVLAFSGDDAGKEVELCKKAKEFGEKVTRGIPLERLRQIFGL